MQPDLNSEFFAKGFEEVFEREALEKKASEVELAEGIFQKLQSGVENAVARGILKVTGKGLKGAFNMAMGDRLPARHKRFISQMMLKDPILKNRPKERVISNYKTMVKVSPSISLDENIVGSFLRESTAFDTMSTVSIKSLLDLEKNLLDIGRGEREEYGKLIGIKGKK